MISKANTMFFLLASTSFLFSLNGMDPGNEIVQRGGPSTGVASSSSPVTLEEIVAALQKAQDGRATRLITRADYEVVASLIQKGRKKDERESLLHLATRFECINSMQALIEKGVAVDIRDSKGNTPLMTAAWGNKSIAVGALISSGANLTARNNFNNNIFHISLLGYEAEEHPTSRGPIIALLVRAISQRSPESTGTLVQATNNNQKTPLAIARENDLIEIVENFNQVIRQAPGQAITRTSPRIEEVD